MEGTIGEIRVFSGNFAPRTWSLCQGQILDIASHTALFAVLGTTYGGDGRTTFQLPDLRGRTMIGPGTGPGLPHYSLGFPGGRESILLTNNQLPSHFHLTSTSVSATGSVSGEVKVPVNTGAAEDDTVAGSFIASSVEIFDSNSTPNTFLGDLEEDLSVNINNLNVHVSVNATGGSQAYDNMMPVLALNYIICLTGVFPTRN